MIKSIEISNFRGFRHVALSNLPRFNILIGRSGSGKTAFLESIWVESGISPEIYFRMRAFRGMAEQQFQLVAERSTYEAVFSDIFHDPTVETGALIQTMDTLSGPRCLSISYGESTQMPLEIGRPQPGASAALRPLRFRWKVGDTEFDCPLKVVNNQIVVENPPPLYPGVFFASSLIASAKDNAEKLSILSIDQGKEKIVETLTKLYPQILDLSSESISGQQLVWAKIKGLRRKIPLAVVSSGINKFTSILLGICFNRGGVLLVDEIDNSFYFLDYENVWRTLVEFCDAYEVQVFAATHNWEFLKTVAKVMDPRKSDLSMLRTKFLDGECGINQIEGVSSVAAIEQDIEIRE